MSIMSPAVELLIHGNIEGTVPMSLRSPISRYLILASQWQTGFRSTVSIGLVLHYLVLT